MGRVYGTSITDSGSHSKEAVDNFKIQMSVPSILDQGSKFQNGVSPC